MSRLQQFRLWNAQLGLPSTLLINVAFFEFSYLTVSGIHLLCHRYGFWMSKVEMTWADFISYIVAGVLCGWLEWDRRESARTRVASRAPGSDPTMI